MFSGMNIHLPAILGFTTRVLTHISQEILCKKYSSRQLRQVKGDQKPDNDGSLMGFNVTAVLAKMADRSVLVAKNREGEQVALRLGSALEPLKNGCFIWLKYGCFIWGSSEILMVCSSIPTYQCP